MLCDDLSQTNERTGACRQEKDNKKLFIEQRIRLANLFILEEHKQNKKGESTTSVACDRFAESTEPINIDRHCAEWFGYIVWAAGRSWCAPGESGSGSPENFHTENWVHLKWIARRFGGVVRGRLAGRKANRIRAVSSNYSEFKAASKNTVTFGWQRSGCRRLPGRLQFAAPCCWQPGCWLTFGNCDIRVIIRTKPEIVYPFSGAQSRSCEYTWHMRSNRRESSEIHWTSIGKCIEFSFKVRV